MSTPFKHYVLILLQGLIQSVFELHDGSGVVVTIGKYVTPNLMDINGNGIEPDYKYFPGKDHDQACLYQNSIEILI